MLECPSPSAMPPPEPSHEKRILPVDGLRAIAVMGVIWAHLWSFGFGAPALPLGRLGPLTIDLNRLMSFWGTGVDLFFVISGLCMHLVYTSKPDALQIDRLVAFVKKRWLRIAPAYYAAVVACAIIVGATSKKRNVTPRPTLVCPIL